MLDMGTDLDGFLSHVTHKATGPTGFGLYRTLNFKKKKKNPDISVFIKANMKTC